MHPKITILGCGLGGMITALGFAKHNISTTIIERRVLSDKDFFEDIRTTALTFSSVEFFKDISIWKDLSEFAGPFNDIYVADNKADEMLHFASSELPNKEVMGQLVQNTEFKKCLFDLVESSKFIEVLDNTTYEVIKNNLDTCQLLLNNNKHHDCDLLVVCDGRHSSAKRKYFSNGVEKSYNQYAITFIVYHAKPHEGTAVEHFMQSGPFAILPLKDQHLSSVVWTIPTDRKEAIMNLPGDEFNYLIQENFGNFLGEIQIKSKIAAFPLKAYITNKYYNKKIVLVADTAHVVHPLAGQGLNQGIKDIESLISSVLQYGVSDYALENYQRDRKTDNSDMLEITNTINAVFSNNSKLLHRGRQIGFKAIENIPPFKKLLIKYAMGKR